MRDRPSAGAKERETDRKIATRLDRAMTKSVAEDREREDEERTVVRVTNEKDQMMRRCRVRVGFRFY